MESRGDFSKRVSGKRSSFSGSTGRKARLRTAVTLLISSALFGFVSFGSASVGPQVHVPKVPKLIEQNPGAPFLVARDNYYSPRYLQVKVRGGSVLSIENKGANTHGLIIPAFAYQGVVQPGGVQKIRVPKKKAGLYDFYCPYHKGMRGTIEIVSAHS
ncbi:MAG: cupredoxin domain-containing protein [Nitrospirae bacterium]|nr:cupredoxin domain-containing protein [Candidatus Manganitrophaceae bacterium]